MNKKIIYIFLLLIIIIQNELLVKSNNNKLYKQDSKPFDLFNIKYKKFIIFGKWICKFK